MVFRHHRWGQRAFGPQEASARNVSSWHNRTNESGTLIRPLSVVPSECVSLPAPGGVRAENCKLLTVTVDLTGGLHRLGRYSVHVHSPPPADCGESAVGYVDIVPRAIATDTAPRSVCEGAVHQIAVDGAYFLVSNGRPPVVNLQRIERTWDAVMDSSAVRSRLAHEAMTPSSAYGVLTHSPVFGAGGVMGVDVRSNVFGVFGNSSQNSTNGTNSTRRYNILLEEDNNRITDVRVTAVNCTPIDLYNSTLESCTRMLLEFDTTNHPFGLYAVGIVNLPVVDCCACGEKMPTLVNIVPRAEVHATGPTHVCEGGVHTMTVSGSYFVSTDGAPPTVSLGLLDDSWASVQATADVPRPVSEDKRARGIAAETQNASHVIAASVLSSTGCSNVSTAGSAMVVCDELVISFNTSGQLLGQYGLFVVNLPLADCCDCIQSESMRIDVVPRAEVHATKTTIVCQGSVHTMIVTGSYFLVTNDSVPVVSLGLLANTWNETQLQQDLTAPSSVSKRARGIAADTYSASHIISAKVLSAGDCTHVSTAGLSIESCEMIQIEFDAREQLLGQYGVYVVNLPLADCCDCVQSQTTTIDVVPRAHVVQVEPTAVCEGGQREVIVTGRYFLDLDGVPPRVQLEFINSDWNATLPATATGAAVSGAPAATSNMPTNTTAMQNTTANWQNVTRPGNESLQANTTLPASLPQDQWRTVPVPSVEMKGCTGINASHSQLRSCRTMIIRFNTSRRIAGLYRMAIRNLLPEECCACDERVHGLIDIVPRAQILDVFPPAVCTNSTHAIAVTGVHMATTNGVPPTVALRRITSQWTSDIPNTTMTPPWAGAENTSLAYSIDMDSIAPQNCTRTAANNLTLRRCNELDLTLRTHGILPGLYSVSVTNLPVVDCCDCMEEMSGEILIVPSESTGPTVGGGGVCSQCDIAHVNQLKLLARTRYAHCVCTWWYCCGNKRDARASSLT